MHSITEEYQRLVEKLLYYVDRDPMANTLNYRTIDAINELEEYLLKIKDDNK